MVKTKLLVLFLALTLLAACGLRTVAGSGNVVTQEEAITGFDVVDVSYGFETKIDQGDSFKVVIRADDNLVEYLQVAKKGSTLQIGLKPNPPTLRSATLQAEITLPTLTGLEMSGSSDVTLTGLSSLQALAVDVSGSSRLRGEVQADSVGLNLDGSSNVALSGSAQNATIDASGRSQADLSALSVVDANVKAGGSSQVTVNASGKLDVEAGNSGQVTYLGNPTLGKMDTSGSGSIEPK